ncbi:MAG: M15 family metallopeptidase [Bacilli bacterium]
MCLYFLALLILVFYTKDIDFFYKKVKDIKNPDSLMVLVNKLNRLQSNYVPHDLEQISLNYATNNKFLRKEAKENFEKLSSDAKKIGYSIIAVSAYRDYDYQENLFNNYVKEKGENYALKCSAKAGHSEHQTGLSVDVMGSNNDYDQFEKSKEFDWMKNNSYKYGFILRYPKGKEYITGFKYEPWHYRYVGKDIASIIYTEGITLEEYYKKYIK